MQAINDLPARFQQKIDRSGGVDACWPWLGALTAGYPVCNHGMVRRYFWLLLHGEKPKGLNVICKIGNNLCVNPSHIVTQTIQERTRLAMERGTHYSPFVSCTSE